MRLGKGRLVHAGLVGADGAECVEVGEHAGASKCRLLSGIKGALLIVGQGAIGLR